VEYTCHRRFWKSASVEQISGVPYSELRSSAKVRGHRNV
jgi:hypothetical protein